LMFPKDNNFVFRGPYTWMYSQERIAKKKAPMNNSQSAESSEEIEAE
jgi:hypothetical protein